MNAPSGPRPSTSDNAALLEAAANQLADELTELTNQCHSLFDRSAGAFKQRDVAVRAGELLGLRAAFAMRAAHRKGFTHQQIADELRRRGVDITKSGVGYWINQANAASPPARPPVTSAPEVDEAREPAPG